MKSIITVSKSSPCVHCGKADWCYLFSSGSSVCNRGVIAQGWIASGKCDKSGSPILIPEEWAKKPPKPQVVKRSEWLYPSREGNPLIKVIRNDLDNGKKEIRQVHYTGSRWLSGRGSVKRENIPIYQFDKVQQAIQAGETIFVVEGEKCADALWTLGIPATCNIGGSKQWTDSDANDLAEASLVLCPDRDRPGMQLMAKVFKSFPNAQWLYAFPDSPFWHPDKLADSNGCDIADWIEEEKLTVEQIWEAVTSCREELLLSEVPDFAPSPELHYTEKAVEALYGSGHYAAINGRLYKFKKTHYEPLGTQAEQRRIAEWCRTNAIETGVGKWKFSYANATTINNIWNWLLIRFGIDPEVINPPGLNLKNGTLKLKWEDKKVTWVCLPHSPEEIYTYCSEVTFNPQAETKDCDKLLACLDPNQQTIFLKTIAAALDLNKIRQIRGREVKALLLQGHGNNGKDSLREAVSILFSQSMVNVTVGDFQAYDQGRKFPLAKLKNVTISWASENTSFASLDNLQSLKSAITGEIIDIEEKNQPEYSINPATVFLFNCNESPSLKSGLEAIASRWGILRFNKTYKRNADPTKGEIEADPRFRYDSNFLKEKVAPALLNKLLEELQPLINRGIDYAPVQDALKELQEESNHLWAFCRDTGLAYCPDGKVDIKELWERLREWYQENGSLEVQTPESGKQKDFWYELPNSRDKLVKGANQIHQRFTNLFPKIKKCKHTIDPEKKGSYYLSGIAFFASLASLPHEMDNVASLTGSPSEAIGSPSEAVGEAVSLTQKHSEASEAVLDILTQDENFLYAMFYRIFTNRPHLQQKLTDVLNNLAIQNGVTPDMSLDALPDDSPYDSPSNSPQDEWCYYQGDVHLIEFYDGDLLTLRRSGLRKTIKVHRNQVKFP